MVMLPLLSFPVEIVAAGLNEQEHRVSAAAERRESVFIVLRFLVLCIRRDGLTKSCTKVKFFLFFLSQIPDSFSDSFEIFNSQSVENCLTR